MQKIVFLSDQNSTLGRMAAILTRQLVGETTEILSAGPTPAEPDPRALEAMRELDLDPGQSPTRSLEDVNLEEADLVVTLGQEDLCPALAEGVRRLHWPIAEPADGEATMEQFRTARDRIRARVEVLARLTDLPEGPPSEEFHASLRVRDLAESTRFYAWLLQTWPKEWTHRYSILLRPDLNLNFVLMVSDGMELHHDTLYHVGIGVADRDGVIDAYHRARAYGAHVEKPPRTTWKGTPLHELWLKDPDGTLVEIYARLTDEELAGKPADLAPEYLVPGTEPDTAA